MSVRAVARRVRGIVWRGHVHPSPTAVARTTQRRGLVGALVRGVRGPAWGGSFPPRSLRRGSVQARQLSLRGDLRVVLRRGGLGKFGFAQRNLPELGKVERSLPEGLLRCWVPEEASESEGFSRKTARWAVARLQRTIRLRAHLYYACIYVKQKILCPACSSLTSY